MSRSNSATQALQNIAGVIDGVFTTIGHLRDEVARRNAAAIAAGHALRKDDLVSLGRPLRTALEDHRGVVAGIGVVCATGALADAARWLEWWWYDQDCDEPVRLAVSLEPDDPDFFDYENAAWFLIPRHTGERWIAGPYVDHSGTDEHIFTMTVPIFTADAFFGVAGADIRLRSLESIALPALRSVGSPVSLVNADGRVIASTMLGHLPGELVAEHDRRWLDAVAGRRDTRTDGTSFVRHRLVPWTLVTYRGNR